MKLATTTSIAPTETFYAACADNNVVNTTKGGQNITLIINNELDSPETLNFRTPDSYQCCVTCQQTANCIGTYYYEYFGGFCQVLVGRTCDPTFSFRTSILVGKKYDGYLNNTVSNGQCGQISLGDVPDI